ncbi:MAG: hypothetical protein K2L50_04660 [Bacteroidales bacterium]|nr:hypothetical protein [Bacteroidales bacterium]
MSPATPAQAEMEALIGMMDETDTEIYPLLKNALFQIGEGAVPYLENARLKKDSPLWQSRMESLLRELLLDIACRKLSDWKEEKCPDLLQGFFYLSSAFYPDLSWEEARNTFNRMHGDCGLLLASAERLKERVAIFSNFFFNECKFKFGSRIASGYQFADFLLPNLIHLKQGNDRSLALAYQYLAERNRIPVFLLNLPVVNLLACTADMEKREKKDLRFCIDISRYGSTIDRDALEPMLSIQKQIQLCNTVEALQDHVKLLHFMVDRLEDDPFRKEAMKKLYTCMDCQDTNGPNLSATDFSNPENGNLY